jgi:hypothetical protein
VVLWSRLVGPAEHVQVPAAVGPTMALAFVPVVNAIVGGNLKAKK